MPKRKLRKLKGIQSETIALLEYLLAEAYNSSTEQHYRLKVPYEPHDVTFVIDLSIYFDGELTDDRDEQKQFKITGPNKKRH